MSISRKHFQDIISNKIDEFFSNADGPQNTLKQLYKKATFDYKNFNPFINGNYYIYNVSGTWIDRINEIPFNKSNSDISNFRNTNNFFATDINIPQLTVEYESASTKNRTLNYATRLNFSGDFDINYIESQNADVFKYHEMWFKFIEASKKGYIKFSNGSISSSATQKTIKIPYFNAVWIVILQPLTYEILGLVKLMGVSPIGLPFKEIIGDRSKPGLTPISQAYKCNDIFYKLYDRHNFDQGPFEMNFLSDLKQEGNSQQSYQGTTSSLSNKSPVVFGPTQQTIQSSPNVADATLPKNDQSTSEDLWSDYLASGSKSNAKVLSGTTGTANETAFGEPYNTLASEDITDLASEESQYQMEASLIDKGISQENSKKFVAEFINVPSGDTNV